MTKECIRPVPLVLHIVAGLWHYHSLCVNFIATPCFCSNCGMSPCYRPGRLPRNICLSNTQALSPINTRLLASLSLHTTSSFSWILIWRSFCHVPSDPAFTPPTYFVIT